MVGSSTIESVKAWECMALQMADGLRKVADGSLDPTHFPPGILADARTFLEPVREIISWQLFGKMTSCPNGDLANFTYAHQALIGMPVRHTGISLQDIDLELLLLLEFVKGITGRSVFSNRHKLKISALWAASFFEALAALPE